MWTRMWEPALGTHTAPDSSVVESENQDSALDARVRGVAITTATIRTAIQYQGPADRVFISVTRHTCTAIIIALLSR